MACCRHASRRGQRLATLASPLSEMIEFNLAVDCLTPGSRGERIYPISALAAIIRRIIDCRGDLQRMKCAAGCHGVVRAAWLVTGVAINARVRPRRVALRGPEAME